MDTPAASGGGILQLRIVLLAVLLFAVNAWAVRHLGMGIREFTLVNSFLGFISLAIGVLAKEKEESFLEAARKALARALTLPGLVALYVAAIALTSFISSVTVLAAGVPGTVSTLLTAEGETPDQELRKPLSGPDGIVRFWTLTSPFGSSFYLLADGYQRHSIQLMPWFGATVRLSELQRLPSVLIRVPHQQLGSLDDALLVLNLGDETRHKIELARGRGSVLLGPDALIPEFSRQNMRSELRTLDSATEPLQEKFFRYWNEPLRDESIANLIPGQEVQASFVTGAGKEVARRHFVVGKTAFQDVLLISTDN